MLNEMLHEIGAYFPDGFIWFIVGCIVSPVIIYVVYEIVQNRKKEVENEKKNRNNNI